MLNPDTNFTNFVEFQKTYFYKFASIRAIRGEKAA